MTVWSVEKLTSEAKKHMRLPRACSTPASRHWMLQPEVGAVVASSTPRSWASSGRPVSLSRAAAAASRQNNQTQGSRAQARPCVKLDLTSTAAAPNPQVELKRLRQVMSKRQFGNEIHGTAGSAGYHAKADDVTSEGKVMLPAEGPEQPVDVGARSLQHPHLDGGEKATALKFAATAPPPARLRTLEVSSPRKLTRQLSVPSEAAMRQLETLHVCLLKIERQVESLNALARGSAEPAADALAKMRTELAQLEAEANKLETKGVDNVYTSELKSGRQAAKELKSVQLRRLETLFGVIEKLFCFLAGAKQN